MSANLTRLESRIRRSGILAAIGLIAELASLLWNHPISFFLFLGVGAVLTIIAILSYFFALVSINEPASEQAKLKVERI